VATRGRCVFGRRRPNGRRIEFALRQGIIPFNAESEPELPAHQPVLLRGLKKIAPVALRVNPGVDACTHAKITTGTYENKFGIHSSRSKAFMPARATENLRLRGLQMHIARKSLRKPVCTGGAQVLPPFETVAGKYPLEFFSVGGVSALSINPRSPAARPPGGNLRGEKYFDPQNTPGGCPLLQPLNLKNSH